jgi:hypothetical protein
MAFPLKFVDEYGVVWHYPWIGYPIEVVRATAPAKWVFNGEPLLPSEQVCIRITIWCGPGAPFPEPPTADSFRDGLMAWLFP